MINWYFGWGSILCAFISGAILGLYFYQEGFLGGYDSFQRRILRLGHISLAALGIINILFGQSHLGSEENLRTTIASISFIVGGLTMPGVCFLTAWKQDCRRLFFIPVAALILATIQTMRSGIP